MGVEES